MASPHFLCGVHLVNRSYTLAMKIPDALLMAEMSNLTKFEICNILKRFGERLIVNRTLGRGRKAMAIDEEVDFQTESKEDIFTAKKTKCILSF